MGGSVSELARGTFLAASTARIDRLGISFLNAQHTQDALMSSKGEKRPTPKRLFSFDTLKSSSSKRSSSEGHGTTSHGRTLSRGTNLTDVREGESGNILDDGGFTSPPMPPYQDPFASRPGSPGMTRFELPRTGSPAPDSRWDTLRNHVLPSSRPSTPPSVPSHSHSSRPSVSSSSRPSTPKPSRFPRLRIPTAHDYAQAGRRDSAGPCQAIRYPADSHHPKGKSDSAHSTVGGGSSMYIPFMSTSTLNNGGSNVNATGASKKSEGRRQSQTSQMTGGSSAKGAVSVKTLHSIMFYHAAPPSDSVGSQRMRCVSPHLCVVESTFNNAQAASAERCIWCCKAALTPASPNRSRILSLLRRLLVPGERKQITITHGLFVLQAFLHSPQAGPLFATELDLSKDLIEQQLLEEEYGVIRLPEDTRGSLRKAIFLEALARCLENCALSSRAWLLLNVVEDYWPLLGQEQGAYSPLQSAVHSRKLNTFCRAAYSLLQSHDLKAGEKHAVAQQIVALLETRLIPENALLDQTHALETGASIVRVVVECLVSDDARDATRWAVTTICRWLHHEDPRWKRNMDKHLQKLIAGQPWPNIFKLFSSTLQHIPDADRKVVISIALPHLNDRMLNDPPPDKTPELGNLLNTISRLYPPIFFKPLFLCAVSAKEFTVVNHLCTIVTYSRYVEDFWVRDPEMLSMALLSDTGGSKESVMWTSANIPWTAARLGQSVLMVEFINQLQTMRRLKEAGSYTDSAFASIGKFIVALGEQEKKALIAPSQRMLLCMIFREFRLLTRSMKPAPWLQRTINWFTEFYVEDDFAGDLEQERIHGMYAAAQSGAKHSEQQRRSTMILSSSSQRKQSSHSATPSDILDLCAMFEKRKPLIDGLLKGFPSKALKLLVVVSPMLHEGDYLRIAPILWENASACFLVMQCAEKTSMDTLAMIEDKLEAVRKIGILVNWRFQIMTQNVLADRSHRPFKMARIPLPFMQTESGEKSDVPTELKKQLAELGWVEHDSGPIDPQQIWIKTPMSLFPISQLDRMDVTTSLNPLDVGLGQGGQSPLPSPQPSPRRGARGRQESAEEAQAGVLRRNSTSGGPVASQKRRAIFVPPLANVFIRLTTLLHDPNFVIASTTRSILLDLMRNDPSLLSRPVMDILAGEHKDIELAISTLSNLLDVHQALPPPMSHTIFNHLMGFLKWSARQYDMPETLRDYALTLAMLSSVTTQVSGMSFREIRRSKTDAFVIPSGALWFPALGSQRPHDITGKVISLTVVRISQNLLFLALLKRNGPEVNMIRKSMTAEYMLQPDSTIETLSMVLARSHLMLLAQIFRAMSRHLSDRNELATMIDWTLMVATTRFRRLFTSRTAYTLFVPALIKVYTESAEHPGIRPAIEYAFNRFYALHKDSFLYQSLGVIGQMAMYPTIDEKALAESVYTLFFSLTKAVIAGVDAAGIHNVNKGQEREALIVNTAEEKPQTFLAAIKRADSATSQLTVLFPEEYEVDRLRMDNFIRLFLTVIAHDLSIIRAQHYLRLLRLLAPQLHNSSSSARTVLLEGISALGAIMVKGAPKSRAPDPTYGKASDGSGAFSSTAENHSADQSRIPSDLKAMRMDYLRLILGLGQAGGELSLKTARQGLDIVKLILKDSSSLPTSAMSTYISDFVRMLLIRDQPPLVKAVNIFLQDLAPILRAHMITLDFSGVFETIYELVTMPNYATEASFSQVVIGEICTAGLAGCELAASENQFHVVLSLPFRTAFIKLLAECVFVQGADVVAEIEKRSPTYLFLAGVVFPLVLELKTDVQLNADGLRTTARHRTVLSSAWLRLLFYAMNACQRSLLSSIQRSRSRDKTNDEQGGTGGGSRRGRGRAVNAHLRAQVPVFAMGLQIVKAIVVRAELDISTTILGIWERVASFLKAMLSEGDANFATRGSISPSSPTFRLSAFAGADIGEPGAILRRPRVLDYMLWSTLEFLWAYRSPLRIQLRLLTTEKIVALDLQLRMKGVSGGSIRTPMSSHPPSPRSRLSPLLLPTTNPSFSGSAHLTPLSLDPRSTPSSRFHSPANSPFLDVQQPATPMNQRRPGYQISPSPFSRPIGAPRIVHLGPTSPSALQNQPYPISPSGVLLSNSNSGGGSRVSTLGAGMTKIKSIKLVEGTYRRIRGVQALMGYELLLPLPSHDEMDMVKTWTRSQALAAIGQETKDLLEEFDPGGPRSSSSGMYGPGSASMTADRTTQLLHPNSYVPGGRQMLGRSWQSNVEGSEEGDFNDRSSIVIEVDSTFVAESPNPSPTPSPSQRR
ncbi:hypothetical protein DFP72DRAFT_986293 [Ephemerocybe angulata]|uniref:Protein UNC80 C-terminal domain-containing protein n=1 Tax=Ephemerocybe angulata TaxID=980116 RepID=A0A8H6IGX6_9AGAR|nr:hypothetical protein DFP72DRAFT_986293 [Tulosesus angulatus]